MDTVGVKSIGFMDGKPESKSHYYRGVTFELNFLIGKLATG